jgi:hypothetical protein
MSNRWSGCRRRGATGIEVGDDDGSATRNFGLIQTLHRLLDESARPILFPQRERLDDIDCSCEGRPQGLRRRVGPCLNVVVVQHCLCFACNPLYSHDGSATEQS